MQRMTRASNRRIRRIRRGYALVSSLVAVLVLLTVGASLFGTADTGSRLANRRMLSAQAQDLAFAGADLALKELRTNRLYSGFGSRTLGDGLMSATVVPVSGQPTMREITGTGVVANRGSNITKRVRYTVDLLGLPPALRYTLIVDHDLSVNGDVRVVPSALGGPVSVHTNGNADLSGSAIDITGKLTASGTVNTSGSPKITGGTSGATDAIPFPTVDESFKDDASADGVNIGNVTIGDGSKLKGSVYGDLVVATPNGCRVDGIVWVSGSVTVKGPVTGSGTVISEGKMVLNADRILPPLEPSSLLFITLSTANDAVTMSGNGMFKGMVFAPNGGITLKGTPTIVGSMAAKSLILSGTPNIIGWDGYFTTPPPAPGALKVLGWQELK